MHRLDHFAAQVKNLLSIPIDNLPHLGKLHSAPLTGKKLLSQRVLKGFKLCAHCGLRQSKLFTRLSDTTLAGHGPEVKKVVVVEPLHNRDG